MFKQGRVTSVFVNEGSVRVNVNLENSHNSDLKNLPVARPAGGVLAVPQRDDDVLIAKLENGAHVVTHVLNQSDIAFPSLGEDELTLRFGASAEVTISENGAGDYNVTVDGASVTVGDPATNPQGAITDLTVTKDANGKVTDVAPVRSTKTNIE